VSYSALHHSGYMAAALVVAPVVHGLGLVRFVHSRTTPAVCFSHAVPAVRQDGSVRVRRENGQGAGGRFRGGRERNRRAGRGADRLEQSSLKPEMIGTAQVMAGQWTGLAVRS
jgi:hypothetical protein